MSKAVIEKVIKINSSTAADVATITTKIIRSSTQQLNTQSISIDVQ